MCPFVAKFPKGFFFMIILFGSIVLGGTRTVSGAASGPTYFFQSPQPLDISPGADTAPATLQASNGTLWVAWDSDRLGLNQIFLKTFNGKSWSVANNVTGGLFNQANTSPALSQFQNGTTILFWSANATGLFPRDFHILYRLFNNGKWGSPAMLTDGNFTDSSETSVVTGDGTLWVFWDRESFAASCPLVSGIQVCHQVFYKTLTGNSWSGDVQLTSDPTVNEFPGATVARDGSIRLAYSKWIVKANNFNIFSQTFNGTQWSAGTQLTAVNTNDLNPDPVEDRNGTLWVFWSREISLNTTVQEFKLFYKDSPDNGQTWSKDNQLTFEGSVTNPLDDNSPVAVQGTDKFVWIFFSSNGFNVSNSLDIDYIKLGDLQTTGTVTGIWPVHDVAVTKVQVTTNTQVVVGSQVVVCPPSLPQCMFPWDVARILVTIANLGDFIESLQLTVQAVNSTTLFVGQNSTFLAGGTSTTFTLAWNATAATPGRYAITASLPVVPGETVGNSVANTLRFKSASVLIPGDLDLDGQIRIVDAGLVLRAFNSRPGSPNWIPAADLDRDGIVDSIDFSIFASNWGKTI